MWVLYVIAALAVIVPAIVTPVLLSRWNPRGGLGRFGARYRSAIVALVRELGTVRAAIITLLAGMAATVAVCWPFGYWISRKGLEAHVSNPTWQWVHDTRLPTGFACGHVSGGWQCHKTTPLWNQINATVTLMGERTQLEYVSVAGAIVFGILWGRRFWIPVLAMLGQFLVEQYTQTVLKLVVHRGHPPTDLGTFPSGGCGRVAMTFGTIAVLIALTWRTNRATRIALATVVVTAVAVEGYTRLYLEKHWLTDIIGGFLFAILLWAAFSTALRVLAGRFAPDTAADPAAVPDPSAVPGPSVESDPYVARHPTAVSGPVPELEPAP